MEKDFSAYLSFHCPRWNELPSIELYMDQVVSIIESDLNLFRDVNLPTDDREEDKEGCREGTPILTPTMINNYVKHRIVSPPVKKRYSREQLAYLHIICVGKRMLSMSEIKSAIDIYRESHEASEVYDAFCEELESALHAAFSGKPDCVCEFSEELGPRLIFRSCSLAFAYKVYSQCVIEQKRTAPSSKE